jgi:hypothetical protein
MTAKEKGGQDVLATPAWLMGRFGPWGKTEPGELKLADNTITFTSHDRGLLLQTSVAAMRIRFPRLHCDMGMKLGDYSQAAKK